MKRERMEEKIFAILAVEKDDYDLKKLLNHIPIESLCDYMAKQTTSEFYAFITGLRTAIDIEKDRLTDDITDAFRETFGTDDSIIAFTREVQVFAYYFAKAIYLYKILGTDKFKAGQGCIYLPLKDESMKPKNKFAEELK
jgi:hypothetical protein